MKSKRQAPSKRQDTSSHSTVVEHRRIKALGTRQMGEKTSDENFEQIVKGWVWTGMRV